MKVATINTVLEGGGAAAIARSLHRFFVDDSMHEGLFLHGRGARSGGADSQRIGVQAEVLLHAGLTRFFGLEGLGTHFSTRSLLRTLEEWAPDILHVHNLHGYYLDWTITARLAAMGIPIVWTLHDAWPITGRCSYFRACDRWQEQCGSCPDLHRYPATWIDRSHANWSRKRALLGEAWQPQLVTPSSWLRDHVEQAALGCGTVTVIPNGVDTDQWQPVNDSSICEGLGIAPDRRILLFVAADLRDKIKGTALFFEAVAQLRAPAPLVVTLGERAPANMTEGLRPPVLQLGYLSDPHVRAALYARADIFCTTALQDNFPTTVLESLACGTPVVGFAVGGILEQVPPDCGTLVPPGDTAGLANAIEMLFGDHPRLASLGDNARKRALDEYSRTVFVDRYLGLYRELLAASGK